MEYVLALSGAYLLGSISTGLIIGRMSRGIDVRTYGSGVTGVTNVLRTMGPRIATLVLVADISKGVIATFLARLVADAPLTEALAGVLVIAGHNWPVFSRFQGGRGVTTAVGALANISSRSKRPPWRTPPGFTLLAGLASTRFGRRIIPSGRLISPAASTTDRIGAKP